MPQLKLTAITPKNLPTSKQYLDAMHKAVMKSARLVERDFASTTKTWEHQPQFTVAVTQTGNNYEVTAGTNDKIYGYVDAGTRAHVIRAKRSKYLRFSSGYRAKTRVGVIGSNPGGPFGDTVYASQVNHPGFEGRKFTLKIKQRRQKTMEQEIAQAVAKVNRMQK